MIQKIKSKLILLAYFLLALALAFLVFAIVKELSAEKTGFTKGEKLPIPEEEGPPKFNLSDNVEITQKDCANQCKTFENNPEDLKYCQNYCLAKGFPINSL